MSVNNCDNCGAQIKYSPTLRALKCNQCGTAYPINFTQDIPKRPIATVNDEKAVQWNGENHSMRCVNCGAQIALSKNEIATKCQYCHATSMVELGELQGLKPDRVVPFKIEKDVAKQEFQKRVVKRHFLPRDFKKSLPHAEVCGTYISSFNFDLDAIANYSGFEEFDETYKDNQGNSRTRTARRPINGTITQGFRDIVIEASDKILQTDIENILPYDFNDSYDYDDDFIKGYNVGYYNQTVKDCERLVKNIACECIEENIRSKYTNQIVDLRMDIQYSNVKFHYTLLPAYFINFEYKKKNYFNLMNGQNGKITGKAPRSGLQIGLLTLFILLLIGLPILFILLSI